ncbi:MAG: CRISPR-associated endonuclease Cas1, partial [Lachnospiraceae bacterium]|nr:CRISPR-associated endonuclease Cas1 [Lachnospiraceae bacterium]
MSFRTIAITKRSKLSLSMGFMEVRTDETLRIYLDDIDFLIIESQAVSMTSSLLSALMKKKVKIIFCDEKNNPQGELLPFYGSN